MPPIVQWIVLSAGWPRRFTAFAAGAIGALALAPVDFVLAMVVPMTVAVWLIDGAARGEPQHRWYRFLQPRSFKAAAGVGWWWGFGYFLAGFWWLSAAFLVEPTKDAWALPFGVLGVPAVLALFPALAFGVARLLWTPGAGRIVALTAALALSEWLRGWVLTGFPWNNYGMAFGDNIIFSQVASLIGNDGLTVLAIAVGAAPATLADGSGRHGVRAVARRAAPTVLAGVTVAAMAVFGGQRIPDRATESVPGGSVTTRAAQRPAGREFLLCEQNQDRRGLPSPVGPGDLTDPVGHRRCDSPDLA